MGGGDLNMKKSWHPLLHSNQERVWKQEKKALEERRRLDELRREREQEREIQELQRLQEEAGGKKRSERVDWMYATPASGSGPAPSELEDYLLGKKRVDKLLKGEEGQKVQKGQESFIAVQHANTARDTSSKIREDPMLAIRQQEQEAYKALMQNPARLRQMRASAGLPPQEEDSKEAKRKRKEEKRKLKEEKHERRRIEDSRSGLDRRSRDSWRDDRDYGSKRHTTSEYDDQRRSRDWTGDRSSRHAKHENAATNGYQPRHSEKVLELRDDDPSRYNHRQRSLSPYRPRSRSPLHTKVVKGRDELQPSYESYRRSDRPSSNFRDDRSRYGKPSWHDDRSRPSTESIKKGHEIQEAAEEATRQQKLARMMGNATSIQSERDAFLKRAREEEEAENLREETMRERAHDRKSWGSEAKGSFLLEQQRQVYGDGMDLAERLRRGRTGMQKIAAD